VSGRPQTGYFPAPPERIKNIVIIIMKDSLTDIDRRVEGKGKVFLTNFLFPLPLWIFVLVSSEFIKGDEDGGGGKVKGDGVRFDIVW